MVISPLNISGNKHIDTASLRRLYPFTSRYLYINGLKYHYIEEGCGEPVAMIHGNPTWSFYFRRLIKDIMPNFRAIAPDHIGCGLSDKPDPKIYNYRLKSRVDNFEALMNHLNIDKKINLILHDWGGMIGMAYALRHPEKISKIVIMNTAAFLPPKAKKLPLRLKIIRNFNLFGTIAVLGFNLFSYAALYMASSKGLTKDVKKGLTAPYNCWKNRIATLKFVQDIPLSVNDPSFDLVKSVDENLSRLSHIPMLICWGRKDFVFDDDYLYQWHIRFPNALIHTFSDAGHYLLEDAPDKASMIIKNFLTTKKTGE